MYIKDIMNRTGSLKDETGFGIKSMLAIGKKGQVVEGVVNKVSDKISISFNGVEVAVPDTAVQNAREGDKRQFQIMDVSKDSIVLKEVGNSAVTKGVQQGRSIVSTKVTYSRTGQDFDSAKIAESAKDKDSNLKVITGDDYKEIEDKEGSFEECKKESVERILKRVKEQKEYKEHCREQGDEVRENLQKGIEQMQAAGFINEKSENQIRQALIDADIPATSANIVNVVTALKMSQTASDISDDAKVYIIGNDIAPTISNIYHGQYSGGDAEDGNVIDNDTWQQILPQVESAIEISGVDAEKGLDWAKWLFANDLPVTADTISRLDMLNNIQENMTLDIVLKQIVQAMSAGNKAEDASLDASQFIVARKYIQGFMALNDSDIVTAVRNVGQTQPLNFATLMQAHETNNSGNVVDNENDSIVIPTVLVDNIDESMVKQITAKRQVAEICLRMTISSVGNMAAKGINIETAPLEDIVNELREEENAFYKAQFADDGISLNDDELKLMQEAMKKTSDIASAPAAVIGSSVRQRNLITLNELHSVAISETYQRNLFSEVYEQVATGVDSRYGDSIEKAFEGIPDILGELGLEATDANERAVRILGYNSMPLTQENITLVKEYDAMVNRVIDNMKPAVVLDMIRQGENPLDTSILELDEVLGDMSDKLDTDENEKYSRYLWKIEKTSSINESERDGYIGIYRLLRSIEKTDGAAIGAVLNQNKDVTLGNLLTAVRTMNGNGIDISADKDFAGIEADDYNGKSITSQIDNGFKEKGAVRYMDNLISDTLDKITPAKVLEVSGGDIDNLLGTTVESFSEGIKKAAGDEQLEKAYYEESAEKLREIGENSVQAEAFLENMGIKDSLSNLSVAKSIIEEGYSVLKDTYKRSDVLDDKQKSEYKEILEEIPDMLIDDEMMEKQYKKADKYMEDILSASYKDDNISTEELGKLKLLGRGIGLNNSLVKRRSYEIPIIAGNEIKTMNLTILNGYDDEGKILITMNDEGIGKISAQLRVNGDDVKGLILCDSREGYERFVDTKKQLESEISDKKFNVKNIAVGIGTPKGDMLKASAEQEHTDTSRLYAAAKVTVRYISRIISFDYADGQ